MARTNFQRWKDYTTDGAALSLNRKRCIVHDGWQFSADDAIAANGTTTKASTQPNAISFRLFSTSVGLWNLKMTGTAMSLQLSADGTGAYTEKLAVAVTKMHSYLPLLVEAGAGKLFLFEYCIDQSPTSNNTNRIWYSSDGGETWGDNDPDYDDGDPLITTAAGSIRHFHGGYYDSDNTRLLVFTGDSDAQSSILHCTDVADLAADPATWAARWGLDTSNRSNLDTDYVVGSGHQRWRTVSMLADGDYLYFGCDSWISGGVEMSRVHRTTLVREQVTIASHSYAADEGNAVGPVWMCGHTNNGLVVFATQAQVAGSPYYGDGWMHLYLLQPDGATMREIYRIPKYATSDTLAYDIHAVGDYTVLSPNYVPTFAPLVFRVDEAGLSYLDPVTMRVRRSHVNRSTFGIAEE